MEVEHAGARIRLDGIKQRRLFVLLALRAPEAVSSDELLEALWGGESPASAVHALHKQVSRLRLHLGEGSPLRHRPGGLRPRDRPLGDRLPPFRASSTAHGSSSSKRAVAGRGRSARSAGTVAREALADHRLDEFAQHEIARLEELRVEAVEELAAGQARLGPGRRTGALVAEHPLRERLRAQLMLALYQ